VLKSKKYVGVYKRLVKNGDVSFVVIFTIAKKFYKKIVGKKSEGMDELQAFLARKQLIKKHSQENFVEIPKKLTLNDLAEKYFSSRELHSRSIPTIKKVYEYRIGELGKKELTKITPENIEQFQRQLLLSGLKKNTINVATRLLATIFTWGIDRNYYDGRNPAKYIRFSQARSERRRFLSESEIAELFTHVRKDRQLYILTILALCIGARVRSVYQITKKDINFDTGQINIIDIKNNSHYTSYITNQTVKDELETYTEDLRDSDFLFHSKQKTLQKKLLKILNILFNANVVDSLDKVVVHTLRHTFASNLAMAGTSPLTIKKLMNHSSLKITERYVKFSQDSILEAVKKLTFLAK